MRIVAAVILVLVLALQYRLWASDGGMREVWRLRDEVAAQRGENEKLIERNRTLVAEVQDLKQGKTAIEERARTDLGMIGKNESFYQVMSPNTTTKDTAIKDTAMKDKAMKDKAMKDKAMKDKATVANSK